MTELLMNLVQVNFRVPRYLKIAIETAAKLRGLTQDAYLDEALNAQRKFTPEPPDGQR